MRRLILFRHGKSDWDAPFARDHDRPLARRGQAAAETMGRLLARSGEVPDVVYTSTATRARRTAELAIAAGSWQTRLEETPDLYGTSPDGALRVVAAAPDVERVMLVGHEPTWSALAGRLTGGRVAVKTATVVGIDLGIGAWRDAPRAEWGELGYLLQPRMFAWLDASAPR